MIRTYDAIVLGTGGIGSAALSHLAGQGLKVLGLDQFGIAHDRGSSHGESRIIRKAYFEHPAYVPLLHRAYELWHQLEASTGTPLYDECGVFLAGPSEGTAIPGARAAARQHGLPLENLTAFEARERFPQFEFPDDINVVFEQAAGLLRVEDCVHAQISQAQANGAEIRFEKVVGWEAEAQSVRIQTQTDQYVAARLVVTAGAWSGPLLAELNLPLRVLRKPQVWHRANDTRWNTAPAYFFEQAAGAFYGFPARPDAARPDAWTLKLAEHSGGETVTDPTLVERSLTAADERPTNGFVARTLRQVDPRPARHSVCLYTMTPDGHFVIDRHPEQPSVAFAAGFSGHGFKFAPVIGQVLAELTATGRSTLPIEFLGLQRFAGTA